MRLAMVGMVGLLVLGPLARGQAVAAGDGAVYVDENPKPPATVKLAGLEGSVRGLGGDALPRATVSVFTEDGHALVATAMTDKDGKFKFAKLDKGLYRVVARVEGLCPANVPVKVEGSLLAKRKLVFTMVAKDIDTCSYGLAK